MWCGYYYWKAVVETRTEIDIQEVYRRAMQVAAALAGSVFRLGAWCHAGWAAGGGGGCGRHTAR